MKFSGWFSPFSVALLLIAALGSALSIPIYTRGLDSANEVRTEFDPPPDDSTSLGVVWTPPARTDSALQTLHRIDKTGATAVRFTHPPTDTLVARADSLNLHLYVDLPVSHVSASALDDSLTRAGPTLNRLLELAQQHSSLTHIGLARSADTTVPTACDVLKRWTNRIHDRSPSLQTYYVTPFSAENERCTEAVDVPLLDLRVVEAPLKRWEQWPNHSDRVGLGALGTWVRPGADAGLQVPHSPQRQARYLEHALSLALDSTRRSPPAIFIARWQDRPSPLLPSRRYGLHDLQGSPRPAADVVRGFYTGRQRAFAFVSGAAPAEGTYGLTVIAWGLVFLLGGIYTQSLFVRRTIGRYFTAHGFYRDALREGTELRLGTNVLLLSIVAVALDVTGVLAARIAASQPSTERVLRALPNGLQTLVAEGIQNPTAAGFLIGASFLGLLGIWTGALVLSARQRTRFTLSQGIMLVVWPCWPVLLALPVALAAGPQSPISPSIFALLLLGGSVLTVAYFTVRVLLDYQAVTNLPWLNVLPLAVLSPLGVVGTGVLLLTLRYDVPVILLWRLATLTY